MITSRALLCLLWGGVQAPWHTASTPLQSFLSQLLRISLRGARWLRKKRHVSTGRLSKVDLTKQMGVGESGTRTQTNAIPYDTGGQC